ncbi:hypothetical protein J31TS4_42980 [Paenibacillus sp. J31TS4]|uniref:DUF2759 family protein n=1 Tax=Paenibacillus sp. J31TS4 TaxID=2807195 RepID=UPI001B0CC2C7|nr:DUF2759 family protein [Paenibacillus sp. J31TS4]GIP41018.1 hypothetical protein J31TS4_42980 [Paenibacillus sp. J31TS4]
MLYLAEEAAASTSTYSTFDLFVLLFTIIIAIGVVRSVKAKNKNMFAIGFGVVALVVFIFVDVIMIKGWFA